MVIHPTKIRKLKMPGQRRSFATNAFHQIAVRTHGVNIEIEDFKTRPVEVRRQPPARDRHPHAVSYALAERPRGCLYPGSEVRFRMPRSPASQLPEPLDLLQGNCQFF